MASGINLATQYSPNVDERFTKESQATLALNNDYKFVGSETVKVYSIPVAPLTPYQKSGLNRYGTPSDLTRNVQTLTVKQDDAFTFIIDKRDKIMSQMVSDAGKSLSRQTREVLIPRYDKYVFQSLASAATAAGNFSTEEITKENAYSMFLNGMEVLGNNNIPDTGRVCFCSYRFANLLKQDPAFMKYGDASQQMLIKGVIGEVDGCKIVKVASSRLPLGAAFIMTHPIAACAPKLLEDYKIHDNPPGLNGWLVEGRFIFDCFVLNEKRNAIYYHGSQAVMSVLDVRTAATDIGKSTIMVNDVVDMATYELWYKTGTEVTAVTYGTELGTSSGWTKMTSNFEEITPASDHTVVQVGMALASDHKAQSVGTAVLNIG
jgi:N4-gp56 family major capsid protein